MSSISVTSDLARPLRRSSRINKSVPITVMGVDPLQGPYREDVSTVAVSCHGCRYESKHDVLMNSWVMLELPDKENNGETVSARGLVKWVKRPQDANGIYETAIELNDTGNIWGIDTPPLDWITFCNSLLDQAPALKAKAIPAPKHEQQPEPPIAEKSGDGAGHHALASKPSPSFPGGRPVGLLGGQFHEQMERMLFDAADAAVRERAGSTLDEVRDGLREEAKRALAEVIASQTAPWLDQSLKQLNNASLNTARTLHAAWAKRLESDTRRAMESFEERSREFDILAQSLSANSLDRLQRGLESSREEGVVRFVAHIEEQAAPLIDRARETMAELARQREELQGMVETCTGFEKQFEMIIRERLDAAREDLDSVIRSATSAALDNFAGSSREQQAEAQLGLREALQPIAETALNDLKEKAASSSREFAREMSDRGRSYLELVSRSIADAAQALGKLSTE